MSLAAHWEKHADSWLDWTRTDGHDVHPWFAPVFCDLLPAADGTTLEVGCGEGRVCRDLRARGFDPIGVDASHTLVEHAAAADPDGDYRVADAMDLPFADASFDLVVAYNALMDFDDMPGAVAQIARVLRPGGHLAACVTHPFMNAGRFLDEHPDAGYLVEGSYLDSRPFRETFTVDHLTMEFAGNMHPLSAYTDALEDNGLLVEALREPKLPQGRAAQRPGSERWRRIPMFLMFRALKPSHADDVAPTVVCT